MEQYTFAIQLYHNIYKTKLHPSYASILTNIGILYKIMAEASKGIDRMQMLERSEEALIEALSIRKEILGYCC